MSWNHGTYGWEAYEAHVQALRLAGTNVVEREKSEGYIRGPDLVCQQCSGGCDYVPVGWTTYVSTGDRCDCCMGTCGHSQRLRVALYQSAEGALMVAEEYLSVKDQDCDGASQVSIAVYEFGQRPELVTQVLEV